MELYKLATSLYVRPVFDISKTDTQKSIYMMLLINRNLPIIQPIIETHFSNQLPQLKYNSYQCNLLWKTTAINSMYYDKEASLLLEIMFHTAHIHSFSRNVFQNEVVTSIISISMEYDFYNQSFTDQRHFKFCLQNSTKLRFFLQKRLQFINYTSKRVFRRKVSFLITSQNMARTECVMQA